MLKQITIHISSMISRRCGGSDFIGQDGATMVRMELTENQSLMQKPFVHFNAFDIGHKLTSVIMTLTVGANIYSEWNQRN